MKSDESCRLLSDFKSHLRRPFGCGSPGATFGAQPQKHRPSRQARPTPLRCATGAHARPPFTAISLRTAQHKSNSTAVGRLFAHSQRLTPQGVRSQPLAAPPQATEAQLSASHRPNQRGDCSDIPNAERWEYPHNRLRLCYPTVSIKLRSLTFVPVGPVTISADADFSA